MKEPAQPPESQWRFVEELQAPMWSDHHWIRREPREDEAALGGGVLLRCEFPDARSVLETAYDDLRAFLRAGNVGTDGGFSIATQRIETEIPETFRIETTPSGCTIFAGDSEGIRRGIFHIKDAMRRAGGPFMPIGIVERTPVIRTRISRCFFGPIKRPPKYRDELADDVDYYPDEYLNRLAHDGVNALWLSIQFRELCRSDIFPHHGADAERRLEKLRQTVQKCARYGIRIYVFCIEPMAFGDYPDAMLPWSDLELHPELAGHFNREDNFSCFCTSSETGRRYLEESTFTLFNAVPGLGGLIDINLGERATHCYSSPGTFANNNCPRCSLRDPGHVFADTLTSLVRGMQRANPATELVSWLYIPYLAESPESDPEAAKARIRHIAASVPKNVTLQINFESLAQVEQCGRTHTVLDYSLAHIGPSELFRDCALAARENGARVSAKLQVGCSHEVATVPFVPVPGNLFRKYREMHEMGVSTAMQCWYFGNYPSLMNKAAGVLSFAPLPASEEDFLLELAAPDWGEDARDVVCAWRHFRDAYSLFPVALQFSYFGPVHDSVAWPLHLLPVDQPIAPSWLLGFAPSGDRIGECFASEFSLDEIQSICREMTNQWQAGLNFLTPLKPRYKTDRNRSLDIGVAEALGFQFQSALNVLSFYAIREKLPYASKGEQLEYLTELRKIVEQEIAGSTQLAQLATEDSRLGFHSEAEGYKYFPAKLMWRAGVLDRVLQEDFSYVESLIRNGQNLFPEYSGAQPNGLVYRCSSREQKFEPSDMTTWDGLPCEPCSEFTSQRCALEAAPWVTTWQAIADPNNFYLRVICRSPIAKEQCESSGKFYGTDHIAVSIEPRRLWPTQVFCANRDARIYSENKSTIPNQEWRAEVQENKIGWQATLTIPWKSLLDEEPNARPIRINIERRIPEVGTLSWIRRHPLPPRLIFESDNSADYGWVTFNDVT